MWRQDKRDKRSIGENTYEGKGEGSQRRLGNCNARSKPYGEEKGGMSLGRKSLRSQYSFKKLLTKPLGNSWAKVTYKISLASPRNGPALHICHTQSLPESNPREPWPQCKLVWSLFQSLVQLCAVFYIHLIFSQTKLHISKCKICIMIKSFSNKSIALEEILISKQVLQQNFQNRKGYFPSPLWVAWEKTLWETTRAWWVTWLACDSQNVMCYGCSWAGVQSHFLDVNALINVHMFVKKEWGRLKHAFDS